jgi:hypothetical protein
MYEPELCEYHPTFATCAQVGQLRLLISFDVWTNIIY